MSEGATDGLGQCTRLVGPVVNDKMRTRGSMPLSSGTKMYEPDAAELRESRVMETSLHEIVDDALGHLYGRHEQIVDGHK